MLKTLIHSMIVLFKNMSRKKIKYNSTVETDFLSIKKK